VVKVKKSSQAIIHVICLKITDVSGTMSLSPSSGSDVTWDPNWPTGKHIGGTVWILSHQTLIMRTEIVPETLVIFNKLTWLIAREDLNNIHKSLHCIKQNFQFTPIFLFCVSYYQL
jgi:hypothetical protein